MKRFALALACMLLGLPVAGKAQLESSSFIGVCFLVTAPGTGEAVDNSPDVSVRLVLTPIERDADVTVTSRVSPAYSKVFHIVRDSSVSYDFYRDVPVLIAANGDPSDRALVVNSTSPIRCDLLKSEGFTSFAISALGCSYTALCYQNELMGGGTGGSILITAYEDNTTVRAYLAAPTISDWHGPYDTHDTTITFRLNAGQCIAFQGDGRVQGNDLTGSAISADKTVNVVSGHLGTRVPARTWGGNYQMEQMPPMSSWGRVFLLAHILPDHIKTWGDGGRDVEDSERADVVRIVAMNSGTQISINGHRWGQPLEPGAHRDTMIVDPMLIEANQPILVGEFGRDMLAAADSQRRSFLTVIAPLDDLHKRATFTLYNDTTIALTYWMTPPQFYASITCDSASIFDMYLDGTYVPPSHFTIVRDGSGHAWGISTETVSPRRHLLEDRSTSGLGFQGQCYGQSYLWGYGFPITSTWSVRQLISAAFDDTTRTLTLANIYKTDVIIDSIRYAVQDAPGTTVRSQEIVGVDVDTIALMGKVKVHLNFSGVPPSGFHGTAYVYAHGTDGVEPASPADALIHSLGASGVVPEMPEARPSIIQSSASDELFLEGIWEKPLSTRVVDILGRAVSEEKTWHTSTAGEWSMDIPVGLSSGSYFCVVAFADGRSVSGRFIVR